MQHLNVAQKTYKTGQKESKKNEQLVFIENPTPGTNKYKKRIPETQENNKIAGQTHTTRKSSTKLSHYLSFINHNNSQKTPEKL